MEENAASGGFGEHVLAWAKTLHRAPACMSIAIPDEYVEHGNVELLKKEVGVDADSITAKILEKIGKE